MNNRSRLKGACAVAALVVGLGAGGPVRALADEMGSAALPGLGVLMPAAQPDDAVDEVAAEPAVAVMPEPAPPATEVVAVEEPVEARPVAATAPAEAQAAAEEPLPVVRVQSEAEAMEEARARRMAEEQARAEALAAEEARQRAEAEAARKAAAAEAARRQAEAERQQQAQAVQASAQVPPQGDLPGVLTRKGVLVVEPSVEYQHSDINRFVVGGVAILDTVLVGSIEATQADRDAITATLGLRYGVTNRIEAELRIPYMYRDDSTTNTVVNSNNQQSTTSLTDHGLGDIEGALHWQVNDGTGAWPVFVANFRAKSTTGKGPFDVSRNNLGVEEDLATGSGFWGFEPSVTMIMPSDPAVFFANVGYLWNVKRDVDEQITPTRRVDNVDPGDAIRIGFGMGLALNDKVSFSVGYQHDWIMGTETKFTDGEFESESLSVGSLTFGVNWQMNEQASLNVSVGVGVTEDAPDVRLMARMPIALELFR